jgi:shikimate kinase
MDAFVRLETEAVLSVKAQRAVIATGGSVIYSQAAMVHLAGFATVVYLSADIETIRQRLGDASQRGLAGSRGQSLEALLAERLPLYQKSADIRMDVQGQSVEAVANSIYSLTSV